MATTPKKTTTKKKRTTKKKAGFFKKVGKTIWANGKDLFSIPSLVVGFALGAYFF